MNRIFKISLKVILLLIILFTGFISYTVYKLEHSIDIVLSNEQKVWLYNNVENSDSIPNNYIETLGKYYPGFFENNFWQSLIISFLKEEKKYCQCDEIYINYIPGKQLKQPDNFLFNLGIGFRRKIITLDLEKRFSQRKCFEYNMSISKFGHGITGLRNASIKYFNKELDKLNEKEILVLNYISKAPTFYNRPNERKKLEYRIEKMIEKHKLTN